MAELGARGMRFAIATPHRAATRAGLDAFDAGGTAVDAALAAAVTLAVVYPHMCGVGGDLFALVREPDAAAGDANTAGRIVAVNASGASPRALDVHVVRSVLADDPDPRGSASITVPGAVSGWAALARWSSLGLARAVEPAIALARDGVPVASSLALGLGGHRDLVLADPGLGEVFAPGGVPLRQGSNLRQPAIARTLEAIASDGTETLYGGDVGASLVAGLRRAGSAITVEDLAAHQPVLDSPLVGRYRDLDVSVCPPNSQGFALLQTLAMIERLGIDPDPLGPDAVTLAEIHRVAASDRDRHNADPTRLRVPVGELLEDGHLAAQCEQVRAHAAVRTAPVRGDTVALVAADAEGRAVSIVQSLSSGFGSGILEPETGILLHNRGQGFSPDPDSPNALAGGVRPAHTLMPAIVQRDDRLLAAAGTMGGGAQPQIVATALIRALELGMTPAEALDAPRHLLGGMDFPVGERFVEMEARIPDPVRRALEDDGYRVVPLDERDEGTGHAHLIVAEPDGSLVAGTDLRADGEAGTR